MKSYDLITPEGTRDLLYEECAARRSAEETLRRIFISHGYSEVITPALEFYDVFNNKTRSIRQESMYKLTDEKGRLMSLRPDSTLPIARIVATRLRGSALPLKLFYSQNIYRSNPKMSGRDDEITQSGIEIIGGGKKRSDLEALSLAAQVLDSFDSGEVRLEIGDNGFYKFLIKELGIEDDETIRVLIKNKNTPELESVLAEFNGTDKEQAAKMLLSLPGLFGAGEVFEQAERLFDYPELKSNLAQLKETYDALCKLEPADRITVDLGLVNKADYYTGIIFRGYIEEYGQAVISGGRYDTLIGSFGGEEIAAVGFAANINAIAAALTGKVQTRKPEVLVFAEEGHLTDGIRYCNDLSKKGHIAEYFDGETFDEAKKYAEQRGITRVDVVGANGAGK
ncbi:MAG: ATP phosphoribosyltransferase regulatory subunit [Eubacterium sp.]|nr:ATP phosphoribosyltransferase regulatory subunit [Eubacterium sp.]